MPKGKGKEKDADDAKVAEVKRKITVAIRRMQDKPPPGRFRLQIDAMAGVWVCRP